MTVLSLIDSDGEVLLLDAVTSFSKQRSNSVTESSVMSGANVGDGIRIGNYQATFSGVCTTTKIRRRGPTEVLPPTPLELDAMLERMVLSQKRFTLYGNHLINTIPDVVITSHNVLQEVFEDSVTVSISVKQVFVADAATQATITIPSKQAAPEIPKEEKKGAGTKTVTPDFGFVYRGPSLNTFSIRSDLY